MEKIKRSKTARYDEKYEEKMRRLRKAIMENFDNKEITLRFNHPKAQLLNEQSNWKQKTYD